MNILVSHVYAKTKKKYFLQVLTCSIFFQII